MIRIALWVILWMVPAYSRAETVLVLGDSISAGYGLSSVADGWVHLMEKGLESRKVSVVNGAVSGDTTAGGLNRLPSLLKQFHPQVVVIELGGNDGLRGLSIQLMEHNLGAMIEVIRASGAKSLLLGMQMPAHYGVRFQSLFDEVYPRVAKVTATPLVPRFLEGVGDHPELMQADGVHPNAKAQPLLCARVMEALEGLLQAKTPRAR